MPVLVPGLKTVLDCAEGQEVVITIEYICATDVDSDDSKLTYLIARQPYHGVVLKNGIVVDRFFQEDIETRIISYKHTGIKATHSLFLFVSCKNISPRFWSVLGSETRIVTNINNIPKAWRSDCSLAMTPSHSWSLMSRRIQLLHAASTDLLSLTTKQNINRTPC